MECDLYRVEQGNRRHLDITSNWKTKSSYHTSTTQPKVSESFEVGSRLECTTETNAIVSDNCVVSNSSNVCDNYSNKLNTPCDYNIITDKGANKETLLSSKCTVQLSLADGLPSRHVGNHLSEHVDNKHDSDKCSTNLPDKMAACSTERSPTSFVIEHLSLSVSSECVQKLDELVKHFLSPGNHKPLIPLIP